MLDAVRKFDRSSPCLIELGVKAENIRALEYAADVSGLRDAVFSKPGAAKTVTLAWQDVSMFLSAPEAPDFTEQAPRELARCNNLTRGRRCDRHLQDGLVAPPFGFPFP